MVLLSSDEEDEEDGQQQEEEEPDEVSPSSWCLRRSVPCVEASQGVVLQVLHGYAVLRNKPCIT